MWVQLSGHKIDQPEEGRLSRPLDIFSNQYYLPFFPPRRKEVLYHVDSDLQSHNPLTALKEEEQSGRFENFAQFQLFPQLKQVSGGIPPCSTFASLAETCNHKVTFVCMIMHETGQKDPLNAEMN